MRTFEKLSFVLSGFIYVISPSQLHASENVTHQYDELGRLISSSKSGGPATGSQTTTAYDPAGNRTNQTTSGASGGGGGTSPPPPPPPSGNQPPVANANSVSVMCNASTTVNVTANDTDPEGNLPLTVQSVTLPPLSTASATVVSASTIQVYGAAYAETTLASYVVSDTLGASSSGTLTIITTGTFAQCSQ